jgi:hypothetical protein
MTTNDPSRLDSVGDTSVVAVLARFAAHGWSANHVALDRGRVRCGACDSIIDAADMRVEARHRVEGASDPSEMQIVYGLACPACSARGALVASYGPASSEQSDDIVTRLPDGDAIDPLAADATDQ